MKRFPIIPGAVVRSMAGRDQGRLFLVISEVNQDFVLIANGSLRKMDHLKKKRRRHVKPIGTVVQALADRVARGEPVEDHEIRSWLKKEEERLVQV